MLSSLMIYAYNSTILKSIKACPKKLVNMYIYLILYVYNHYNHMSEIEKNIRSKWKRYVCVQKF